MPTVQIAIMAIGAVVFLILLRRAAGEIFGGGGSRKEQLRRLDVLAGKDAREAKSPSVCPLCGGDTVFHRYPHIDVWRCAKFPECRGFVKSKAARRPAFAVRFEKKKR